MSKRATTCDSSVAQQVLAGQPLAGAGVDEAVRACDQHRAAELGQIVGELVQLARVEPAHAVRLLGV